MQGILVDERASTRVAVAMAGCVLALLAVAAVPMLVSQGRTAQDTRAQTIVKRLVDNVETCRVGAATYRDCDEEPEVVTDPSVHWGRSAGKAGLLPDRSTDTSYTAYAVSGNGSHVYVLTRHQQEVSRSVCGHGSVERLERDGCDEPGW